ncbi:MAG: ribonuclease P protein component [bacterium]|nr:ribonuclease P protein component [bacterium]
MLKKNLRIRKQKNFDFLYKKGKRTKSKFFAVIFTPNDVGFNRFAFIVSSKVDKRAVARNKLKRRMREITRANYNKIKPSFDFIIIAFPQAIKADFNELKADLWGFFNK